METEIKRVGFAQLREAYSTVRKFLEYESGNVVKSLDTRVDQDLGLAGDDNYELIEKFVDQFQLDHEGFDYSKHFYSEGELFGSGAALMTILSLPYWLVIKGIDLLTLNHFHLTRQLFKPNYERLDLSFRDMLTWYIEGKYKLATEVKYKLRGGNKF